MARIDELPPDQRAALQLLLKQGRSYEEIATMLRIEPRAVRDRARSALDALGPDDVDGLELDRQDEIADYLLGQQSASRRARTRDFLETSAPGRAWARVVAGELRELVPDGVPEIPAEATESAEAFEALQARTAHRERVERSSRVGGAILLAGIAAVIAVAIILLVGGGDDGDESGGTATTGTQTTRTQPPQVEAQVNLAPPEGSGSEAAGVAQVARQDGRRAVALVAQGLQAAGADRFYAIWLYTSERNAKFLGFPNPQPDRNGRIETGFSLPDDAREFRELVVTRETRERPRTPGAIVLRGRLRLPSG